MTATLRNSWPLFACILMTAVVAHYAKEPILVIAPIAGAMWCWLWFCRRFPRTALFTYGFLRGLYGRR